MKKNIVLIGFFICLIGLSCSKVETKNYGVKMALEKNTAEISNAISKISETKGYQILSLSVDPGTKSAETFNDSITLNLIAGIYDYQPDTIHYTHYGYPYRLFEKTGISEKMIINLPQKMIFHPKYLRNYMTTDSILKNDFTISVADYHFYYNWFHNLDYKLNANLSLNSSDIGSIDISAVSESYKNQAYSSKYTFTEGYNISTSWKNGDTTQISFSLQKDDNILLKETTVFIGTDFHKREKQYILSIGNIDIMRSTGSDSILVYMDGVLQKETAAKITDSSDTTGSICHKRDILLTFDDGSTAKLSELIGPALTQLQTLVSSLHEMYFAKNIVDYIAVNIYYNSR